MQVSTQPLVSVITISRNSGRSIRRTIESVLAQTYSNIEYIVIDGGSSDRTVSIAKEYGSRISTLISEPDNGISDAFNKGIRLSKGKFIQLINADDILPSGKIAHSIEAFEKYPDAAFVFGDIIKRSIDGSESVVKGDPHYIRSIRFVMNRVNHPTMLVKKEMYDRFGYFDLQLKIAMDYDWILRIHNAGMIGAYSSEIVVITESGGISDADRMRAFKECRDISLRHGVNPILAYSYYSARIFKHIILSLAGVRS
jgi:glycosyltransferase involved in cell wall biosynthesis